ncbi:MAG: ATP synthase F1 subunit delta [Syntrophobacterales bacterium]|nr:ATP synthase F1 subunit delta [Syntrophobacterales bacterium]
MINRNIARRYAKAFFKVAAEGKIYQECYDELVAFANIIKTDDNLYGFLTNPIFSLSDKKAVMEALIEKRNLANLSANFLKLLVDKRRIVLLPDIMDCYRDIMDKESGMVRVAVKTAFPLSPELSEKLRRGLETMTRGKVEMTILDEPELLGGIVVRIGNTYYDGSVRAQLNDIQNLLGEEI